MYSQRMRKRLNRWGFEMAVYVTVTSGMRGYFAVLVDDSDGFPEPVQSGIGSYHTATEAEPEARDWALSEGIPFIGRSADKPIDYSQF
jgi:hypothetical protein